MLVVVRRGRGTSSSPDPPPTAIDIDINLDIDTDIDIDIDTHIDIDIQCDNNYNIISTMHRKFLVKAVLRIAAYSNQPNQLNFFFFTKSSVVSVLDINSL